MKTRFLLIILSIFLIMSSVACDLMPTVETSREEDTFGVVTGTHAPKEDSSLSEVDTNLGEKVTTVPTIETESSVFESEPQDVKTEENYPFDEETETRVPAVETSQNEGNENRPDETEKEPSQNDENENRPSGGENGSPEVDNGGNEPPQIETEAKPPEVATDMLPPDDLPPAVETDNGEIENPEIEFPETEELPPAVETEVPEIDYPDDIPGFIYPETEAPEIIDPDIDISGGGNSGSTSPKPDGSVVTSPIDPVETEAPETEAPETEREPIRVAEGYGKTTISGNALYVYEMIEAGVLADTPETLIELDRERNITVDDVALARYIFLSDHPECFWWSGSINYSYNSGGAIYSVSPIYTCEGVELSQKRAILEARVAEIVATVPDGSAFEKALYLHDLLAERVTYKFTENDQTPYGALVEREAVCNGYATAYQLLLMRVGIRAWTVNGSSRGVAHAWNVVWLDDDTCVYTDVTWDDQDEMGVVLRNYFNMSLDEIATDHIVNNVFVLPECGHDNEGYYEVTGNIFEDNLTADAVITLFSEAKNGKRIAQFIYSGDDFDVWLQANSAILYRRLGAASITYTVAGNEVTLIAVVRSYQIQ